MTGRVKVTRPPKNARYEIPAAPSGADRVGNERDSMDESTATGSGESFAELYEQSLKTVKEGEVVNGGMMSRTVGTVKTMSRRKSSSFAVANSTRNRENSLGSGESTTRWRWR